jgi:hypothetical protein
LEVSISIAFSKKASFVYFVVLNKKNCLLFRNAFSSLVD